MGLNYSQVQRTTEWYRERLGLITGSKAGVLMKSGRKDAFSETAKTYMYQVAGERAISPSVLGDDDMVAFYVEQSSPQSKAMRFGTEQETYAKVVYEDLTGRKVSDVGFCRHPRMPFFGSSPDGITEDGGRMGCLEVKCPSLGTFSMYAAEITDAESLRRVNPDYYYQCLSHMACTGARFCDFVAYCAFAESPMRITRIERDEAEIAALEERVALAETEIEKKFEQIKSTEYNAG